jgi:O-antigen chain-terminating methyltransferase
MSGCLLHYFPNEMQMKKDRKRYVDFFPPRGRILDIGCGRGEFLELLNESGRAGLGIELDPALVDVCRQKGLQVEEKDALSYLRMQIDASWDGIFLGHIIEHLTGDETYEILSCAAGRLNPGGRLVIITPNPNFLPGIGSFWSDITHQRPYSLQGLKTIFGKLGIREISNGVSPESRLRTDWRHPWEALINVMRLFVLKLIVLEDYSGGEIYIVGEK